MNKNLGEGSSRNGDLPAREGDLRDQLENFRATWKKEIRALTTNQASEGLNLNTSNSKDVDDETAAWLFFQGVDAEKSGNFYEAVQFYKKAIHLVPNIESICCKSSKDRKDLDSVPVLISDNLNSNPDNGEEKVQDVINCFSSLQFSNRIILEFEQKGLHIGDLPKEIILYILKWVITCDLDMYSWGRLSQVCKSFYIYAQDEGIWKSACQRLWGKKCERPVEFLTWKAMYIGKPHVKFNGCYISKTSYIRNGETNFQDQSSRPWHLVQYFRYMRFFPEGKVLFYTTPDDPSIAVPVLKNRSTKVGLALMEGQYQCLGNMIVAVCKRRVNCSRYGKAKDNLNSGSDFSFHLNLEIIPLKKQSRHVLKWKSYTIRIRYKTGQEVVNSFDTGVQYNFPPFSFSLVKSYSFVSPQPLE